MHVQLRYFTHCCNYHAVKNILLCRIYRVFEPRTPERQMSAISPRKSLVQLLHVRKSLFIDRVKWRRQTFHPHGERRLVDFGRGMYIRERRCCVSLRLWLRGGTSFVLEPFRRFYIIFQRCQMADIMIRPRADIMILRVLGQSRSRLKDVQNAGKDRTWNF